MVSEPAIIVFWRPGCPFCYVLKLRLRLAGVRFAAVNVWRDESAAALVRAHNGGDELVPTVRVGDTYLSAPTLRRVRHAISTSAPAEPGRGASPI